MEHNYEKQPTSIRLSHEAKMLVEELSRTFGISQTAVYEQSIRRWARQEGIVISVETEAKVRTSEPALSSGSKRDLVSRFWDGFQSRFSDRDTDIKLNKPYISPSGGGKSWRSSAAGLWRNGLRLSVQINASKNYADVNITGVGEELHDMLAELYSQREQINDEYGMQLEWKLNPDGESWVRVVRINFQIADRERWEETYEWLFENLETMRKVFAPRIFGFE